VLDHDLIKDLGSNEILEPVFALQKTENIDNEKNGVLERVVRKDDFQVNSLAVLCQKGRIWATACCPNYSNSLGHNIVIEGRAWN
jgi:hypothetical protein